MSKAVLSKFLVDRIHRDWIDRLYSQGWEIEQVRGVGGAHRGKDDDNNVIATPNFPENYRNYD